jgi:hypothetical protein
MKTLSVPPALRRPAILVIANALLAIVLTIISFRYVRPLDCYRRCPAEDGAACPAGTCRIGDQKAGWPLPVFIDSPGGGSPVSGWGILGPEDLPGPLPLFLDLLFYNLLLWLGTYGIAWLRGRRLSLAPLLAGLPLNLPLAAALWLFLMFFPYVLPVGRGTGWGVYLNTASSISAVQSFRASVRVPLEEVLATYGSPDEVLLLHQAGPQGTLTRGVLRWDSSRLLVTLPQREGDPYPIREGTAVEKIIFVEGEEEIMGIDGQMFGDERIPWRGYGDYGR